VTFGWPITISDIRFAKRGSPDFFDFLAKVGLNVGDDEEGVEQEDEGEA
jgi:hypothetical protein